MGEAIFAGSFLLGNMSRLQQQNACVEPALSLPKVQALPLGV